MYNKFNELRNLGVLSTDESWKEPVDNEVVQIVR